MSAWETALCVVLYFCVGVYSFSVIRDWRLGEPLKWGSIQFYVWMALWIPITLYAIITGTAATIGKIIRHD